MNWEKRLAWCLKAIGSVKDGSGLASCKMASFVSNNDKLWAFTTKIRL
jgi:hypothetical protein